MEKAVTNKIEKGEYNLTKIPKEILTSFEITDHQNVTVILDIDEGKVNNWQFLDSNFNQKKIHLNPLDISDAQTNTIESTDVELIEKDPQRRYLQYFIFKDWSGATKEHMADLIQCLSFNCEKTNLFYFKNGTSEGFAIHKSSFPLNDPKGLARIVFSDMLSPTELFNNILFTNASKSFGDFEYKLP